MSGVGNVSSQLASTMINGAVGMNVLKKSLDTEKGQMDQLLQSVTQTNPNIGNNLDVRA